MNKIFRFLSVGLLVSAFAVFGSTSVFGQDVCGEVDAQNALQDEVRNNYNGDQAARRKAIEAGKNLLQKYGSCEFSAEFVAWLKPLLPKWEKRIADEGEAAEMKKLFERFDAAVKADNYDEMVPAGKAILAKQPDNLNILVPLGIAGAKQTNKQPDETIRFAQTALSTLKTKDCVKKDAKGQLVCGAFKYEMTEQDAVSELTYAIGYLNFWVKKDKKSAIPFYYQAITSPGSRKDDPYGYATLGDFYREQVAPLGEEYARLVKTRSETDTPEAAAEKETKIKAAEGLLKAYLDRAIDAYSRAYNASPKDAAHKQQRDTFYKAVEELYALRFQKKDGIDAYIASTVAKPMPNPTTEVTPVVEAETAATTGGAMASVNQPAVNSTATAKLTANEMVAPVKSAAPKAAAKKPAAKKKGTR